MKKSSLRQFMPALFMAVLLLGGCAGANVAAVQPLYFGAFKPVPVNVAMVSAGQAGQVPFVDEGFVVSPYASFDNYIRSRFTANGVSGTLSAKLDEASVVHTHEDSAGTVTRYLNVNGRDVFNYTIAARLEHVADNGQVLYSNTVRAQRTLKLTEHTSIAERESKQRQALEAMFADIDREILRVVLSDMKLGGGQR